MRIVIEREAEKYKDAMWRFYQDVLRPVWKWGEHSEETAETVEQIRDGWFRVLEEHSIDLD